LFGIQAVIRRQAQKLRASSVPPELHHLRILLAEDNTVNQRIAVRILEKLGWKVTVVNNGQEVLNILNDQTFDVILMDDNMPLLKRDRGHPGHPSGRKANRPACACHCHDSQCHGRGQGKISGIRNGWLCVQAH
jgi:hypothetical protein